MSRDIIKVIVCEDGISCREVNPLGEKPEPKHKDFSFYKDVKKGSGIPAIANVLDAQFEEALKNWQKKESSLRVFTIENEIKHYGSSLDFKINGSWIAVEFGSTHSAEIIDKDKLIVRIV